MTATQNTHVRCKLTKASLNKYLIPPVKSGNPTIVYDSEIAGFGAYRTSDKPGSFFCQYRVGKRQRKTMIGKVTEIGIAEARNEAAALRVQARRGVDVVRERQLAKDRGITLEQAFSEFLETLHRKGGSPRTVKNYNDNWKLGFVQHARKPLADITKSDLRNWHTKWGYSGPTAANQKLRLFRAIYNHALRTTDGLPPNPSIAVQPFQERGKRAHLSWDALPAWNSDVRRLENPIRRAFWPFLLYSGLRKSDATSIKWEDVGELSIHRPSPKGGRLKAFDLPLSGRLSEILQDAYRAQKMLFPMSDYVFPANSSSGHLETISEKTIPYVRPHMLRRTFATACVEAGLDPYTTKHLLNHTVARGDVTALYI